MGKNNRERRRAKEKARRSVGTPRGAAFGGPGSGGPGPWGPDQWEPGPDPEALVHRWVHQALDALAVGDQRAFDAACTALSGPSGASGEQGDRRRLERVLRGELLAVVAQVWERGWQPVDLLRYARREVGAQQQRLLGAVIVAELASYPPDTVDPRWQAQLTEAGVARRQSPGHSFLTAAGDSWPGGWPGLVPAALELVWRVSRVGPLQVIGPVPGRGRVAAASARADVDARLLARVRALLAKAESTTFPAEAETFTAGAQALMARHSIDAALLAASDTSGPAGVTSVRIGLDNPYESPKAVLLNAVADANRCRAVWMQQYGCASVVGFLADLDAVELLFTSLLVQATTGLTAAGARSGAGARARSRSYRQSFLIAFASRIGERLTETMQEQTAQATAGSGGARLLPVLAARSAAVEGAVGELFPSLVTRPAGSVNDAAGWASGRAAADLASLNARSPLPAHGS